jgi:MFS-type transporter involved in bile tolerance (Atg22 family)
MLSSTRLDITLPSSGSVPSAFWEMFNWGAIYRILWMGVLCLVTWCVRTTSLDTRHTIADSPSFAQNLMAQRCSNVCRSIFVTRLTNTTSLQTHSTIAYQLQQVQTCTESTVGVSLIVVSSDVVRGGIKKSPTTSQGPTRPNPKIKTQRHKL